MLHNSVGTVWLNITQNIITTAPCDLQLPCVPKFNLTDKCLNLLCIKSNVHKACQYQCHNAHGELGIMGRLINGTAGKTETGFIVKPFCQLYINKSALERSWKLHST